MSGKDNPKDKALAAALLKVARIKVDPLSWNLLADGRMIIVLVSGPKMVFEAVDVVALGDKGKEKGEGTDPVPHPIPQAGSLQESQKRGYKDPNLEKDMQTAAKKAGAATPGPEAETRDKSKGSGKDNPPTTANS